MTRAYRELFGEEDTTASTMPIAESSDQMIEKSQSIDDFPDKPAQIFSMPASVAATNVFANLTIEGNVEEDDEEDQDQDYFDPKPQSNSSGKEKKKKKAKAKKTKAKAKTANKPKRSEPTDEMTWPTHEEAGSSDLASSSMAGTHNQETSSAGLRPVSRLSRR